MNKTEFAQGLEITSEYQLLPSDFALLRHKTRGDLKTDERRSEEEVKDGFHQFYNIVLFLHSIISNDLSDQIELLFTHSGIIASFCVHIKCGNLSDACTCVLTARDSETSASE